MLVRLSSPEGVSTPSVRFLRAGTACVREYTGEAIHIGLIGCPIFLHGPIPQREPRWRCCRALTLGWGWLGSHPLIRLIRASSESDMARGKQVALGLVRRSPDSFS